MKFVKREPSQDIEHSLNEWVAGEWAIVELAFLFGQHRVQVWHERPQYKYPDVVPPNF